VQDTADRWLAPLRAPGPDRLPRGTHCFSSTTITAKGSKTRHSSTCLGHNATSTLNSRRYGLVAGTMTHDPAAELPVIAGRWLTIPPPGGSVLGCR
jgi:hypothetical protein